MKLPSYEEMLRAPLFTRSVSLYNDSKSKPLYYNHNTAYNSCWSSLIVWLVTFLFVFCVECKPGIQGPRQYYNGLKDYPLGGATRYLGRGEANMPTDIFWSSVSLNNLLPDNHSPNGLSWFIVNLQHTFTIIPIIVWNWFFALKLF